MKRLQAQKCAANMKRRKSAMKSLTSFAWSEAHRFFSVLPKARFTGRSTASFFMHRRCASLKKASLLACFFIWRLLYQLLYFNYIWRNYTPCNDAKAYAYIWYFTSIIYRYKEYLQHLDYSMILPCSQVCLSTSFWTSLYVQTILQE